jgi:hypothetical protein
MGFYHAVPGHIDSKQAIRAVGGYEGAGNLKNALFAVVLHVYAVACGGFLFQQLNFYGVAFKTGRPFSGKEPLEIDVVLPG